MSPGDHWHKADQPMPSEVAEYLRANPGVLDDVHAEIIRDLTAEAVSAGVVVFDIPAMLGELPTAELWGRLYFPRVTARMRRARQMTLH
jgi:hypothetical protein